jgi:glycosyl transferase family 25
MNKHILNECFDKIYVITLKNSHRIDRIKNVLSDVEYELFYGADGEKLDISTYRKNGSNLLRGQLGCAISHINIYKEIVKSNYNNVLILEDDINILPNILNLKNYMDQLPNDWGLFYLGHDGVVLNNTFSQNLCEINTNQPKTLHCTHAIAIRPWFAEKLIVLNKDLTYTADGLLTEATLQYGLKSYAAIPKLINPDFIDSIIGDLYKKYGHE